MVVVLLLVMMLPIGRKVKGSQAGFKSYGKKTAELALFHTPV
jgi:hypothetical protein